MKRIGEVAKETGVTTATLRFYESENLIFPGRSASGIRTFSEEDVSSVHFIRHMLSTDMSVLELRRYVELQREGNQRNKLVKIVRAHRERITNQIEILNRNLRLVDRKIEIYETDGNEEDLFDLFRSNSCE
ncbi:MerR family transcriptional regulator [Pauljensenia sp. UMB10120]|uniref:MerR family transcriptional regulator n=1 Tax=Pauljensenia sp. UMB10120 TaxID=3046356 RepID=UPI00254C7247|nr:MerR family transcriptional regulator [Pauljensenia sp. UMB10120]MDK6243483.1 MerR family transcriptional regulator [Pauljensenia sp. UMB10120]